jgi:hypothetical protein
MTDRELLEKAAKAAGIELRPIAIKPASGEGDGFIGYMTDAAVWPRGWFDPLTDDGDALRLAVKLGLLVYIFHDPAMSCIRLPGEHIGGKYDEVVHHEQDPYAATRRAIVRAAAQIGESQ